MIPCPFVFKGNDRDQNGFLIQSHSKIGEDAMIVGCDSTLLYEAFSRGFRTAFFPLIGHYIDDSSFRFAWPKKTENKGLFWSNIPDEEQLYKVLEYLLYVPEIEWGNQ